MNFNAHVLVAQLVEDTEWPETASTDAAGEVTSGRLIGLGSTLPDLASIAGCRLVNDPEDGHLRRGVDLHHATDKAFHRHEWFLDRQRELFDHLDDRGLGRGAARACAHVGIELLIDGYLLRSRPDLGTAVQASFQAIPTVATSLTDLASATKQARWRMFLARSADWPRPDASDYVPEIVAQRLHRILEPRRRLRFDGDQIPHVEAVLEAMVVDLEPEMEAMLTDVVAAVDATGAD